jgi:putative ABC transport system permease protein
MRCFEFPWQSALAGLGTGLLTTLLFCLPPLLDVRAVRPVLVLRRLVEQGPSGIGRLVCALVGAAVAAGHFGSGDCRAGRHRLGAFRFAQGGRVVCAAVHHCAGGSAGAGGRCALDVALPAQSHTRLRLPSFLRHGLANLYRPGNQSAAVLAALGTGVMLILAVYLMQAALLRDLRETASPKLPNIFLVDVRRMRLPG